MHKVPQQSTDCAHSKWCHVKATHCRLQDRSQRGTGLTWRVLSCCLSACRVTRPAGAVGSVWPCTSCIQRTWLRSAATASSVRWVAGSCSSSQSVSHTCADWIPKHQCTVTQGAAVVRHNQAPHLQLLDSLLICRALCCILRNGLHCTSCCCCCSCQAARPRCRCCYPGPAPAAPRQVVVQQQLVCVERCHGTGQV